MFVVSGNSNLPDGAVILCGIQSDKGTWSDGHATVEKGAYQTEIRAPQKSVGNLSVVVSFVVNPSLVPQPAHVLETYGLHGEKIQGPQARDLGEYRFAQQQFTLTPVFRDFEKEIIHQRTKVEASQIVKYTVDTDTSVWKNVELRGTFRASGGMRNNIQVYVMKEAETQNLLNSNTFHSLYSSGRVTTGDFAVPMPPNGKFCVVLDNTFSLMITREVDIAVDVSAEAFGGYVVQR